MSGLPPELKQLMRWARQAPPIKPPQVPLGFAGRVIALRTDPQPNDLLAFGGWAWAAATLILVAGALLLAQKLQPSSPYDLTPAYQVVSIKFIP